MVKEGVGVISICFTPDNPNLDLGVLSLYCSNFISGV